MSISEHRSFSRAAEALGTVQSNISTRIARLERELGTELVDRSSGTLTESGAIVVERAHRILGELRAIAADVHELSANVTGQVTLGMIGTAGRWVVPLLLESLRLRYPNINLRISEGTNSALEPRLVNGQLDLAVLAWPVYSDELSEVDLFTEDLLLIARRDHPLAQYVGPNPVRDLGRARDPSSDGRHTHTSRDRRGGPPGRCRTSPTDRDSTACAPSPR